MLQSHVSPLSFWWKAFCGLALYPFILLFFWFSQDNLIDGEQRYLVPNSLWLSLSCWTSHLNTPPQTINASYCYCQCTELHWWKQASLDPPLKLLWRKTDTWRRWGNRGLRTWVTRCNKSDHHGQRSTRAHQRLRSSLSFCFSKRSVAQGVQDCRL